MKSAFDESALHNLLVVKEAKRWLKAGMLQQDQYERIKETLPSSLYQPNFIIRVLLFLASIVAISGITGIFVLVMHEALEHIFEVSFIVGGIAGIVALEGIFIRGNRHYKSGVNEALLYISILFIVLGFSALFDFNTYTVLLSCVVLFSFSAYRYLDLLSTAGALCVFAYFIFYILYEAGGILTFMIPFAIIMVFTPLYFLFRSIRQKKRAMLWGDGLIICETLSLLFIYAGGNYFVVRELTISMLYLELAPGQQDIPYAFTFYFLTIVIPVAYLYFGIKPKDVVLLRVSLLAVGFSVFTFKYYFSLGHPEITLTLAGALLIGISVWLFRYLKIPRDGYVRDVILSDKWSNTNVEAFVMSQTLGGNKPSVEQPMKFGGGSFGGGGSGGDF